jgi:hypothetical protein
MLRQRSCHTVWVRLLIDKSSSWTNFGVFSSPTTIVTFHPSLAQLTPWQVLSANCRVSFLQFRFLFLPPIQRSCETSRYIVVAHRRSGVWPQFAEVVFISGRNWTELRQHLTQDQRSGAAVVTRSILNLPMSVPVVGLLDKIRVAVVL